jgi:hypothetical protein
VHVFGSVSITLGESHCIRLPQLLAAIGVAIVFGLPTLAHAQFLYYSPMTTRSLGMGAVASADPSDGTNAWANPAVISSLNYVGSTACYSSYSIPSLDFHDFSALLGGTYSTPRFGATAAMAYHSKTIQTSASTDSDNAYHLLGGARVTIHQLTFGAGLARKSYSLPPAADKDRNVVTDVGVVVAWRTPTHESWHVDGSGGYSWMNNGDEAETALFGPIQIVSTQRYGTWWALHSPEDHHAVLGESPVSLFALAVAFDGERATSRSEGSRYFFGSELLFWNLFVARAGYVHDDILYRGARDGSFGFGIHLSSSHLSAQLDYARFPVLHDIYSNSVGAELTVTW